jgi:DeoR family transcriptional regulator of aga operon
MLEDLHVDLAVLSCNGIEESGRVSNLNLPEAELKRLVLRGATRRLLAADASKFRQSHLGAIGSLDDFDVLVTGGAGARDFVEVAARHDCDALFAEP